MVAINRLGNKVSIVTGGGSGIGRGIALQFAKEGSGVVVADISAEAGEETVKLIQGSGGQALFVKTDVAKSADVKTMVERTVQTFGRIDVLCNNAGIFTLESKGAVKITDLTEETWDLILDINLKGVFLCCKYAVPEMIKAGGGAIVNISSIAGHTISFGGAYGASKAGIIALTKSVALQFADFNIRANVICPGAIDTPGAAESRSSGIFEDTHNKRVSLIPRRGTSEDIAQAAVYLASEEAAYVNAAALNVDGGVLGIAMGKKP